MKSKTAVGVATGESGVVYRLVEKIGGRRNGGSAVFEAISDEFEIVAIKLVQCSDDSQGGWEARWDREVLLVWELKPSGVVVATDIIKSAECDGCSFKHGYVMRRFRTLFQYLKSEDQQKPTESLCIRLGQQIATCLRNLHNFENSPLLHRDIKPDNLLWDDDKSHVVLADPGIIREISQTYMEEWATEASSIVGTPGFMAPEQCGTRERQSFGTDIFGLGATLYCLLTGRPPFPRDRKDFDSEIALQELCDPYPAVPIRELRPDLSSSLEAVIKKCLQKQIKNRYKSCDELLDEFRLLASGHPVQAPGVTLRERVQRVCHKHRTMAVAGFLLCVVVMALAGVSYAYLKLAESNAATVLAKNESTNSLIRVHLSNAERLIEENDLLAAIPDVVAASQLDSVEYKDIYDRRIGTLLHYGPRLKECWSKSGTQNLQYLPQSQSLVAFNREGMHTLSAHGELSQTEIPSFKMDEHEVVDGFVSPGERFFVSRGSGGHIHVVDRRSSEPLNIAPLNGEITSVQISNADNSLAVGVSTGDVALWPDLHSFTPAPKFVLKHTMPVTAMAFSPDGTRLAVGTGSPNQPERPDAHGGLCCLWRVSDGSRIGEDLPHDDDVVAIKFRPDGFWLATGTWTGARQVWDGVNGRSINVRGLQMQGTISSIDFSPDGSLIASSAVDGTVSVNSVNGIYAELREYRHESDVVDVAFLLDNSLVTAGRDRRIKVWSTQLEHRAPRQISIAHDLKSLTPCRDSEVATSDASGVIKHWQTHDVSPSTSLRVRHGELAHRLASSKIVVSSGRHQSSNSRGGEVYCIDTKSRSVAETLSGVGDRVEDLVVSQQHAVFGVLTKGGELRAWHWGADIKEMPTSVEERVAQIVGFLPQGQLVIITNTGTIKMFEMSETGFWNPTALEGANCVAKTASLRDNAVCFVSQDGRLQLWDLIRQTQIAAEQVPETFRVGDSVHPLIAAISPNCSLICYGAGSDLWAWRPNRELCRLASVHSGEVTSIGFSPDGEFFAVSNRDHTVSIWRSDNLESITTLQHGDEVNQVVFSPSGKLIASVDGSESTATRGMARVWEVRTGVAVSPWLPHQNDVYGVVFGDDDSEIWTASWDGAVRRWVMPSIELTPQQRLDVAACLSGEVVSMRGRRALSADDVSVAWDRSRSLLGSLWPSKSSAEMYDGDTWLPPNDPDPDRIRKEFIQDAQRGNFAVALEKHVWYHQYAHKLQPGLVGVRLSYALTDWVALGKRYPPARASLIEIKDDARRRVFEEDDCANAFQEFRAINRALGNDIETANAFTKLDSISPDKAKLVAGMARESLLRAGLFHLYAKHIVAKNEYE